MHGQENHAECVLLRLWLRYNGKQRISIRAWRKSFFCAINYPGSWANGTLTACFFSHIKKRIGEYKKFDDLGFPWAGNATGILVGLIPKRSAHRLHGAVCDHFICLSNVYTSLWQKSEWGMCGLQGSFSRCKNCLPLDKDKRQMVLEGIIFLHNFWTEVVGLNQISEVISPEYEHVINIHGYNQIQRYYFNLVIMRPMMKLS